MCGVVLNFACHKLVKYRNIFNDFYTCIMHADGKI